MHRAALDRSGTDQGDLDDEVVEAPRLEPRQRGHLRPRLDLEHPDRVGAAQHGVDLVLLGQLGEVDVVATVLADEIDGVVQGRQHPQAEEVELDEPGGGAVVLVPLQHGAIGHPPPLHRAHLDHRAVADHHPPGVDAEVAGGILDLGGEVEHLVGDRSGPVLVVLRLGHRHRPPAVDALRPGVLLAGGVAERLGHVADRRARPVGDHVGDLGGVVAAVLVVDVLDDLLAAVALDVDVDVRRAVALGRQEAFEQQAEGHGVGGGDPEGVADRRVGGRATPLAVDVGSAAELDEVPDDQEVTGEPEVLDDVELTVDRLPRPGSQGEVLVRCGPLAIAVTSTLLDDATQMVHFR